MSRPAVRAGSASGVTGRTDRALPGVTGVGLIPDRAALKKSDDRAAWAAGPEAAAAGDLGNSVEIRSGRIVLMPTGLMKPVGIGLTPLQGCRVVAVGRGRAGA